MSREVMQQALEALELLAKWENPSTKWQVRKPKDGGPIVTIYPHKVATNAATLLRERLAQPEQEPVAWINGMPAYEGLLSKAQRKLMVQDLDAPLTLNGEPLYTAPKREWVGLTDEEISAINWKTNETLHEYARNIEAKLKEKNT